MKRTKKDTPARKLAEIATRKFLGRMTADERAVLVERLTTLFIGVVKELGDDERKVILRELKALKRRPSFRAPPAAVDWVLRRLGRLGLRKWLIGRLPRSDMATLESFVDQWETASSPKDRRKVLGAAVRFGMERATSNDASLIEQEFAGVAKTEAAMAFIFDSRGLPPKLSTAVEQAKFDAAVDALLADSFGLPPAGNEDTYAAIKGILLLNEQFDFEHVPTFKNAIAAAWTETLGEAFASVTPEQKVSNRVVYGTVADSIPLVPGHDPDNVSYQELASVSRFVSERSQDVPLDAPNFATQLRLGLDRYVGGAPVFESLNLPPLGSDAQIVRDNVKAVGTIAACYYLEKLRLLDVVDRITELFHNGMLPIGFDAAGRALHDYYWNREDRLRANERMSVYSRVLGAPGGEVSKEVQPNKEFESLLNRFIASVAEYDRQRNLSGILNNNQARPITFTGELVRKAGNDLGRNASLYGYGGSQFSARMLTETVQTAIAILSLPQIQSVYGVTTPYQVIERVASTDFNTSVNVVKYKTMAEAVKSITDVLARTADKWTNVTNQPLFPEIGIPNADISAADATILFNNAQYWIAVNGVTDQQVEKLSQPVESKAGPSLPLLGASPAGGDTIAKLQQMVSGGNAPSLDQLRSLLPVGNA